MEICGRNNSYRYMDSYTNQTVPRKELEMFCGPYMPRKELPIRVLLETKLFPVFICIIIVTNVSICVVLTKRHMISPTNIILFGMAISDMLTGLFPLPIYLLKNLDVYTESRSVPLSYASYVLAIFLPTVCHTASIWLTVVLAVQRFVYISFPSYVQQICTNRHSIVTTIAVYVIAVLFHLILLTSTFHQYTLVCGGVREVLMIMKCNWTGNTSLIIYYWLRMALMHVLPCFSLTVFTVLLLIAMHHATQKRKKLLCKSKTVTVTTIKSGATQAEGKGVSRGKSYRESTKRRESNATSKMLLVVVALFLTVEIPGGVVITLYNFKMTFPRFLRYIQPSSWQKMVAICNITVLVSYPINFFVYCVMSKKFRETFKALFCLVTGIPVELESHTATRYLPLKRSAGPQTSEVTERPKNNYILMQPLNGDSASRTLLSP